MPAKTKQTKTDAIVKLLVEVEQLNAEAEALMQEHGIPEKLAEVAAKKKQATKLVIKANLTSVEMPDGGRYDLRQDAYNKRVVGDDEELAEIKSPQGVIPLKTLLRKRYGLKKVNGKLLWQVMWRSVSSRRVDMDKLEQVVKDGKLTVDEISPAYSQDLKAPYLRRY